MNKVVIIDDEEDVRAVLELMVSEVTEEYVSFESANQAEDYIKSNKSEISLIISDHRMPEKSGLDVYESIIDLNIPFALCTGMHPGDAVDKYAEKEFYVLEKPFEEDKLIELLEKFANS